MPPGKPLVVSLVMPLVLPLVMPVVLPFGLAFGLARSDTSLPHHGSVSLHQIHISIHHIV